MRTVVRAFLLGAVGVGIVAFVALVCLGIVATESGWRSFRLGLGPAIRRQQE